MSRAFPQAIMNETQYAQEEVFATECIVKRILQFNPRGKLKICLQMTPIGSPGHL